MKQFLCIIGFHKWGRASFIDHSVHSSILDWKQKCDICGKKITWVQPKGLNENFYPISLAVRTGWLYWLILILLGYLAYKYFF